MEEQELQVHSPGLLKDYAACHMFLSSVGVPEYLESGGAFTLCERLKSMYDANGIAHEYHAGRRDEGNEKSGELLLRTPPIDFYVKQSPCLQEALAHLRTLATFGGTLDQAKELAAKAIERVEAIKGGAL